MTLTTSSQTTELACGAREAAAACIDVLREVVAGLDPEAMLATEAPAVWACFDEVEKLGAAAKMVVARRVDESAVWRDAGMRDAAEYLALRGGTTREAARNSLQVSTRLPKLPAVEGAVRRGELSAAQAHPIADAASDDPASERRLLGYAKTASLKELRDECLRIKAAADPDPEDRRRRIRKNRYFRQYTDAEGAWRFSGRGTTENAGVFTVALDLLIDHIYKKNTANGEGEPEPREALAFDALIQMARQVWAVAHGHTPNPLPDAHDAPSAEDRSGMDDGAPGTDNVAGANGTTNAYDTAQLFDPDGHQAGLSSSRNGSGTASSRTITSRPPGLTRLRVLRLDLEALCRGQVLNGELCEVSSLGTLTVDAARELLNESVIKLVSTHGQQVLHVTHVGQSHGGVDRISPQDGPLLLGEWLKTRPPAHQLERTPSPPTHLAILRADIASIERRAQPGDQTCDIPGVGPVSLPAARDLLGSSLLKLARQRGVPVSQTIHRGRQPTVAQRVALLWAQPSCSVAGCAHTFTQIDHRHDWHRVKTTELANLDRLCTHHHSLKSHQGWALMPGTGKRPMVPPHDPRHPTAQAA